MADEEQPAKKPAKPRRKKSKNAILEEKARAASNGKTSAVMFRDPNQSTALRANDREWVRGVAKQMLVAGFSVEEVAETTGAPRRTVFYWQAQLTDEERSLVEMTIIQNVSHEMSAFLGGTLRSMSRIAQYCSTKAYLDKHSPNDVAKLLETVGTHAFRLIEAKHRVEIAKMNADRSYTPTGEPLELDDAESEDGQTLDVEATTILPVDIKPTDEGENENGKTDRTTDDEDRRV